MTKLDLKTGMGRQIIRYFLAQRVPTDNVGPGTMPARRRLPPSPIVHIASPLAIIRALRAVLNCLFSRSLVRLMHFQ